MNKCRDGLMCPSETYDKCHFFCRAQKLFLFVILSGLRSKIRVSE